MTGASYPGVTRTDTNRCQRTVMAHKLAHFRHYLHDTAQDGLSRARPKQEVSRHFGAKLPPTRAAVGTAIPMYKFRATPAKNLYIPFMTAEVSTMSGQEMAVACGIKPWLYTCPTNQPTHCGGKIRDRLRALVWITSAQWPAAGGDIIAPARCAADSAARRLATAPAPTHNTRHPSDAAQRLHGGRSITMNSMSVLPLDELPSARAALQGSRMDHRVSDYLPHPFADLLPAMSEPEYAELRDSIRDNGQREPITLDSTGMVLDGRHRARACAELGRPVASKTFDGDDSEVLAFVLDLNVKRRHLDASQRAMIAADLEIAGAWRGTARFSRCNFAS